MKNWIATIVGSLFLIYTVRDIVNKWIANDPIQYFSKQPLYLFLVAGIAITGGLIALLFSRLSPRHQRCVKLLSLGSVAAILTGVAGYFLIAFARLSPPLGGYEFKRGFILISLCVSVIIAFVCMEFYQVYKSQPERVVVTDGTVTRYRTDGVQESIRWHDLSEVGLVTTDEGPYSEDVFWMLLGPDQKTGCAVPQSADGADNLLVALQKLPGFDNEAVIKAMGSTSNARFVCWRKSLQPNV